MSDTMLLGILRMPFDLALSTPTAQIQYHQTGVQAADEIERLRAKNKRLTRERATMLAEIERLRAQIDGLEAELALMKSGFEIAYRLMGEKP